MKNSYKIILLLSFFTCFSCQDFLKEEPKSEMSIEQFFSAPSHAQNAVNALYRGGAPGMYIEGGLYSGTRAMLGQYMSGFFDNEYKGQEPHIQHAQQLTLNGSNLDDYLAGIWGDLYVAIARANNAIKYIPDTPGLGESEATRLSAEARFFRAFAYFYLVRMFGEVPLVTEPYESLENMFLERSSVKEVYDLIVADLEFAVNEGGLSEASMFNNGYRVTRGAAATLLTDVYLTMSGFPLQEDHYADAATVARSVIANDTYHLTQHSTNNVGDVVLANSAYNKIRREEALANEYVYMVEFFVGIQNNMYPQWSYPVALAADVEYAITNGAYQPVPEFRWGYDTENDLRMQEKQYFHTTLVQDGEVVQTFAPTPYIWHDNEALFETAASGKDLLVYSYSNLLLMAAEAMAKSEGVTAEAVNYLTQVRSRAYWKMTPEAISAELAALSPEDFVEEVWKERFRELPFEFTLWFDMVRTRKYPLTSEANAGEISYVDFVGQQSTWGNTFQEKHLLFPLPERERQRNPGLSQNEGYE